MEVDRMFRRTPAQRTGRLLAAAAVIAGTLVSTVVASAAGSGAATTPAPAPTTYFSSAGAFAFTGHGSGHGHGLSQWGAYGAATEGLTATQILDFYYPGTATGSETNPVIRVHLVADDGAAVEVVPDARTGALTIVDHGAANRTLALPATVPLPPTGATPPVTPATTPVTAWRVVATGTGSSVLQGFWSNSWQAYPVAGGWTSTGALEFTGATGVVTVVQPDTTQRDYAGSVSAVQSGNALIAVNNVPAESYLRSVVPSESPSSWPAAALQAQAVAARTYAASVAHPSATSDICDTTACQVYNGLAAYSAAGVLTRTYTAASTDAAVTATAGVIRTYAGAPIFAQFASADGGWTVAGDNGEPYLPAQADPYDGVVPNGSHDWTQTVTAAAVGKALGIGVAQSLTVLSRDGNGDWGGRVTSVLVTGTTGSTTVSGTTFTADVGLRSTWWTAPPGTRPNPLWRSANVYAIGVNQTGSGHVEVHGLTQASGYRTFSVHAATALGAVNPADWRFVIAPYNGDGQPDLYAIELRGGASGRLEVHVLSATSHYQSFLLHRATAQPALAAGVFDIALSPFAGDDQPDLWILPESNTGSGRVEAHVLSATSGYTSFLLHSATALSTSETAGGDWTILVGDAAGSGDLVAVHDAGTTGSGQTEVHILSRVSGYQTYTLHAATPLALEPAGTADFEFGDANGDGVPDLFAILTGGTGSGNTEVHVLDGASGYQTFSVHAATGLGPLPSTHWQFSIG
jgi:stage II sporulation protein D